MSRKQFLRTYIFTVLLLIVCLSACRAPGRIHSEAAPAGPAHTADSAEAAKAPDPDVSNVSTDSGNSPSGLSAASGSDTARTEPPGTSPSEEASALSEKYGVQILYGDEIRQVYRDYTAAPLHDEEAVLRALDVLDRTLSLYPPGFFPAVREGFCGSITICLARDLNAIDQDSNLESAHAFTTVQDDAIWIVLGAEEPVRPATLIHEFTHAADYRLLAMHELQESEWNHLNPPSFSYYNAYLDEEGKDFRISASREYTSFQESDPERIWFYDPYSKTFAMEDRARLMEKLLEDQADGSPDAPVDRCFSSSHIRTKLRFYFYTLREAFGSSLWPDQTVWEEALTRAAPESPE